MSDVLHMYVMLRSDVPDLKMLGKFHACHEKVHSSKNEHGAPVNLHIRKRAKRTRHFVQACAVEMHMDISQGNFCASRRRQKPQATRSEDPDLTAALYSPQWTPCLGNHEKWIFFFGPSSHVPHPYSLSYLAGRLVRALSMRHVG